MAAAALAHPLLPPRRPFGSGSSGVAFCRQRPSHQQQHTAVLQQQSQQRRRRQGLQVAASAAATASAGDLVRSGRDSWCSCCHSHKLLSSPYRPVLAAWRPARALTAGPRSCPLPSPIGATSPPSSLHPSRRQPGPEPTTVAQKIVAFKQAFWKFLRPHTIRGTILGRWEAGWGGPCRVQYQTEMRNIGGWPPQLRRLAALVLLESTAPASRP